MRLEHLEWLYVDVAVSDQQLAPSSEHQVTIIRADTTATVFREDKEMKGQKQKAANCGLHPTIHGLMLDARC
jgi:hypothetical protein